MNLSANKTYILKLNGADRHSSVHKRVQKSVENQLFQITRT